MALIVFFHNLLSSRSSELKRRFFTVNVTFTLVFTVKIKDTNTGLMFINKNATMNVLAENKYIYEQWDSPLPPSFQIHL